MITELKIKTNTRLIGELHATFSAPDKDLEKQLTIMFKKLEIPTINWQANNSRDGCFLWDRSLFIINHAIKTPDSLVIQIDCSSAFNENEFCVFLRNMSLFLGALSVKFWHEDDPTMTSGFYSYRDGKGDLFGNPRSYGGTQIEAEKSENSKYYDEYIYAKDRFDTTGAVLIQQLQNLEYPASLINTFGPSISELQCTLELFEITIGDYEKASMKMLDSLKSIEGNKSDNVFSEIEELVEYVKVALKKYIFRRNQVIKYGIIDATGRLLINH
jgi:hypothetical protein